jgi:hypothetical protein
LIPETAKLFACSNAANAANASGMIEQGNSARSRVSARF